MNRMRAGRARSPTKSVVRAMMDAFAGYDGFILDAGDISTLNQVSTGTTTVTAVNDPIGLMLDKHLGMQLGPERVSYPFVARGTIVGGQSRAVFTTTEVSTVQYGVVAALPVSLIVAGKTYRVDYQSWGATVADANQSLRIYQSSGQNSGIAALVTTIPKTVTSGSLTFVATTTGTLTIRSEAGTATIGDFWDFALSVKLLDGNHPLQSTAAARPSWQVDANGYHYAQLLGTDDSLSCATGGGGSTGFLFCCALRPTGGAGTLRTIYSDVGTNTGYKVQIDTNNKLSFSAGNGTAFTTKVSTADFAVGTTYLLTVWDDGTNLNVQINSEAVETVARPVVVAGTAGYTLFKDNGAASSFAILDFYRADGIKDWAGTAAQLAAIQSWVKAGAGL